MPGNVKAELPLFPQTEIALQKVVNGRVTERRRGAPGPDFVETRCWLFNGQWRHRTLQPEIDNPPEENGALGKRSDG
jgi:hypothetical protein